MSDGLLCWKCGAALDGLLMPLSRRAECESCHADLHVCRLCTYYDPGAISGCDEPRAEEVRDQERANFCDYFKPRPGAYEAADNAETMKAKAELAALFGVEAEKPASGPARNSAAAESDAAREELDRLFGLGDKSKD